MKTKPAKTIRFVGKAKDSWYGPMVMGGKRNLAKYQAFCLQNAGKRIRCTYTVVT